MASFTKRFAFVLPLLLVACGAEQSPPSKTETVVDTLTVANVTTDAASYSVGATVTVTFSGLPGNYRDWIAIAPWGSDDMTYVTYVYTNGYTSGTATFTAPASGNYVARAFVNDTFTLLAESGPFSTAPAPISTDKSTYTSGSTITVTYSGLPGNARDWIAIAPAGGANTSYTAFVYTNGQTSGTATFTAPADGTYVARSFTNDTFNLFAESAPFTVASPTVSTDHASYAPGATITVTYSGLPGNARDWIAIAPAGGANTSYTAFVYTNGQTSGTATFTAPADGSYVARAFVNDTFTLLAESAAFTTVSATISTDSASYAPGATITVTYSGLPGNAKDWIGIATAGSPNTSFIAFVYTNGQVSGTATFTAPASGGPFVARSFVNDGFTLISESAPFTITVAHAISTDSAAYAAGATITVTYSGLPGNAKDWIGIAAAGSANTSFIAFVYTNGQTSGTATFAAPASAGSFVARSFVNDGFTLVAESAPFTVTVTPTISTDSASYAIGATITVSYAGLPGNMRDWIAIAPADSANTSYLSFVYTNGQASGTATFTVSTPGVYVARSFTNDTFNLAAESSAFTVCSDAGGLLCFVASLSGAEEVPSHATSATGSGTVVFNPNTLGITYQVHHTVSGATASHIHEAPAGVNGPVIVPFTLVGQGASGSAVLTQAQANDLLAGNLYMNVHSPTFPGGEIRGQIMKPGQILFVASLAGTNEVPPNASTAIGTGSVIFDPGTLVIMYQLQHTVVGATAAHIHQAAIGVSGPVIVPFTLVGQGASGTATLTFAQSVALQNAGLYMNVHSPTFPAGEIRGQLLRPGM